MFYYFLNMVYYLPTSVSLSYWFNLGSFLGMTLFLQIFSGLILMLNYNSLESYESVMFIVLEVNYGWFMKIFHGNNASFIFLLLYLHLAKGLSFFSYRLSFVWFSGLFMMLLIMGAGFTGYVLVGSQMSLWAAMVITSLISVIPFVGEVLMYMVWGGYSISWVTLQMLTMVHFILPFIVMLMLTVHLIALHSSGSTSIIFSHTGVEKVSFFPFFWVKDLLNVLFYLIFLFFMLIFPYSLSEAELYEEANFLNSPVHIVPEWYFCTFYAILRSVPSKGIGVLLMIFSILILFFYPFSIGYITPPSSLSKFVWSAMISLQVFLTYLGFSPITQPYMLMSLWATFFYFLFHFLLMVLNFFVSLFFKVDSVYSLNFSTWDWSSLGGWAGFSYQHPFRFFHKVGRSKFPFWVSLNIFALTSSLVMFFKYGILFGVFFSGLSMFITIGFWVSVVMEEGLAGNHISHIQAGVKMAFGLFLFSEFMFFFGIFWTFFDSALAPSVEVGMVWPPLSVVPINPMGIPLFNTVVLLSSGMTATYSHWMLRAKLNAVPGMVATLVLAFFFEGAQYVEYKTATFSMSDGVYGSIFYFGTGFHGLHVIMGHIFLFVNFLRMCSGHFTRLRHLSLEMALIYWHFVDVVWLGLYLCFYWWGY